jgi:hypothetical protein
MITSAQRPDAEQAAKLRLAQEAYRQFRGRCFWYLRDDLQIGVQDLDWLTQGLRCYGGREGFLLADKLCR